MFMQQVKIQFRLKNFNLNIILSCNIYPPISHPCPLSPKMDIHCLKFLLSIAVIPREIEDNGYVK